MCLESDILGLLHLSGPGSQVGHYFLSSICISGRTLQDGRRGIVSNSLKSLSSLVLTFQPLSSHQLLEE